MREFYSRVNRKTYYILMLMIIVLMMFGLILSTLELDGIDFGYIIHFLCVAFLTVCLWIYPKHETHTFRKIIILFGFAYFYTLFFLYPQTWTTYILICLIPALSILFFDLKLFYFSFIINGVLMVVTFGYILLIDRGDLYTYLHYDMLGNFINIIAVQVLLFFIFQISFKRMKKQQLYYEQLQQSERLKMVGQLTAAVAHEIRNPVTVVRGFLQFFDEDPSFDDPMKRKFKLMIDELNTVEQIISQFLTLSKPNGEQKLEKVDVKDVLESVTGLLHSYAMLSDNQIVTYVEEDCMISINKIEFKQLLINIIKNALEASEVGKSVSIMANRNNNFIEITIIDEGSGMSEAEVKSLGTPFYSLKSNGTGLGLMICFNIVEKYGGEIYYSSSEGKGTTATIRFLAINDQ
ncbi:two-component sensor histidine kinase [Paenibacillus odorifer]|uniref:histidine kinase n=4 Tax=Paenibacillus TaxID=44249 RepID=A0A1R0X8L6_9BACL|nr:MULTISPECIES: HAMP domain-containing sensor histidine kinase [Paenibacillus]AIQ77140.1 sporulation kinase [Paenibacillus odorifer]ETT59653.1 sporulation kinase B [Paenibacillus sp. FSL H8-237]OMD12559.1 two-component sensor histidine kinase [Paenibacillus odorifer]OMD25908.1 two-component sensor histidine kinase [Paenibacillus odorifer]OMD30985.1 two-component sensor histidine kinase [Paenibacillus odorifer]